MANAENPSGMPPLLTELKRRFGELKRRLTTGLTSIARRLKSRLATLPSVLGGLWQRLLKLVPKLAGLAHRLGVTIQHAMQAVGRTFADVGKDLRPGAERSGTSAESAESQGGKPGSGTTAQVYMVRRIVVFGCIALVVIACVVGMVFGVRSLASATDDDGASSSQVDDDASDGTSDDDGDGGDGTDAADGSADSGDGDDDADDADAATVPLTDDERASILAEAQQTAAASGNTQIQYSYCTATQGDLGDTDVTEFENIVYTTLNDPLGWPRAGATFVQGADTCDMTLILAAADQMESFSDGCGSDYSCRVGDNVIINVDRWNNGTEAWLDAGGTVERYRVMVINHEVGHRLGHYDNETPCGGSGELAPLMLQQSMGLDGCAVNEYPLDSELWITE